jgi:hypothetical protein
MAHKVTLIKDTKVNGVPVSKGETMSVSTSIYTALKAEGSIKEAKSSPSEE